MTDTLEKAAAVLAEKFAGTDDLDAKVKFDIEGMGSVLVDATQSPPSATVGEGEADMTVSAAEDVFRDLMSGALDPTSAFMAGQLKIDGDMGLAMKLASALA